MCQVYKSVESLLDLEGADAGALLVSGAPPALNLRWYYTWKATKTGERIVLADCPSWLDALEYPILHLDFETIAPPLPMVVGTHPFQQVPLEYSLHIEDVDGGLDHCEFIADPDDLGALGSLAARMLSDLGDVGTILQWSQFERSRISEMATNPRLGALRTRLEALDRRIQDLGKAVHDYVFDKDFHGKWSIKKVYPVLVIGGDPDAVRDEGGPMSYDDLDGAAKGDHAAMALLEYMRPETTRERRDEIQGQMLRYCGLDTMAMVEVLRGIRAECERLFGT